MAWQPKRKKARQLEEDWRASNQHLGLGTTGGRADWARGPSACK